MGWIGKGMYVFGIQLRHLSFRGNPYHWSLCIPGQLQDKAAPCRAAGLVHSNQLQTDLRVQGHSGQSAHGFSVKKSRGYADQISKLPLCSRSGDPVNATGSGGHR